MRFVLPKPTLALYAGVYRPTQQGHFPVQKYNYNL